MPESKIHLKISLLGKHNAMNAAAACAAAWAMNIEPSVMQQALSDFSPIEGRLDYLALDNDCFLIDDSYNANPVSMEAALRTLADLQLTNVGGMERTGNINRVAILGDMHELGDSSSAEHKKLGELAADLRIDTLLTCGGAAENCLHSFRQSWKQKEEQSAIPSKSFNAAQEVNDYLDEIEPDKMKGTIFLVKGSRAALMEKVAQHIVHKLGNPNIV